MPRFFNASDEFFCFFSLLSSLLTYFALLPCQKIKPKDTRILFFLRLPKNITSFASVCHELSPVNFAFLQEFSAVSILLIFHLTRYQRARVFRAPFETRGPLFSLPLVADGLFPSFTLSLSLPQPAISLSVLPLARCRRSCVPKIT